MQRIKYTFTAAELIGADIGGSSLTYYMANILKEEGAPIKFNALNILLKPEDIKINGYLRDRIKNDGSHEFIFEKKPMTVRHSLPVKGRI